MAEFILSAFADEISPDFGEQIDSLERLGINMIELRGVNGKSFTELTDREAEQAASLLRSRGISLSALGTPIGKIHTDGDFASHKKLLERIMELGEIFGCRRLRVFSFYPAAGIPRGEFRKAVYGMLSELLDAADKRGFTLCHENEKGIYGQSPESERELLEMFGGRLRAVLDNGNFPFCGEDASGAYETLKDYVEYMHIKDCDSNGIIVPPGMGNACLADTLAKIDADRDGDFILTVEPHLMMFTGLSSLSDTDDIKHKYSFSSSYEAFAFAVEELRKIINGIRS